MSSFDLTKLPSVRVDLYDQIDQAAIDAATEFEIRLEELGILLPDDVKEDIYTCALRGAVSVVCEPV